MENLLQRIEGRFKPESILWLERSVFLKNKKKKFFDIIISFEKIFPRNI